MPNPVAPVFSWGGTFAETRDRAARVGATCAAVDFLVVEDVVKAAALWRIREASETLYWICEANPFTHAVQLVRFALYGQFEPLAFAVVTGTTLAFFAMAVIAYDPGRGLMARRGGPAGDTP